DVLFGKLRPYLKKYYQPNFDGVCSSEIWVLKGKKVLNDFLYFLIQTNSFLDLANQSSGSKMPRADWSILENGLFLFPCEKEQKKISSFLSLLDEKIASSMKTIDVLTVLKTSLSSKIFSREIRFQDENGNDFPEWESKKLGEALKIQGGYAFKSSSFNQGTTKVIRIGDIEPRIILNNFSGVYSNETPDEKYIVKKEDFVMALSGATFGKVGKILDSDIAYINQRVASFKTEQCLEFFYQLVLTPDFKSYINSIPTASAQPNISNSDIANYKTLTPSIPEQQKIAKFLSAIDAKIDVENQILQQLEIQKKYFLANLSV